MSINSKSVNWSRIIDEYIEALIRSRFNFVIKRVFELKTSTNYTRESWDVWRLGDPTDELEFHESIRSYGILVPGCNTLRRNLVVARRGILKHSNSSARIAVLVDCSGSMLDYKKWIYARDAVLMLLGFAMRYRYEACLSIFTNYNVWSHEWTSDHYGLARSFVLEYNPNRMLPHFYTSPVKSLEWLLRIAKKDMTIYIISDMELEELHKPKALESVFQALAPYNPKLVLFLISRGKYIVSKIVEIAVNAGLKDVKGYWVNPLETKKLVSEVIKEINV